MKFLPVNDDFIQRVADDMREADCAEVWASNRFTPLEALQSSVKLSHLCTVVCNDNDEPLVILGLIKLSAMTGTGVPWLLGTENALNYKSQFMLLAPSVLDDMLSVCSKLVNYVHVDNKVSIRWLKRLGFEFKEAESHGVGGELFHRFSMEK